MTSEPSDDQNPNHVFLQRTMSGLTCVPTHILTTATRNAFTDKQIHCRQKIMLTGGENPPKKHKPPVQQDAPGCWQ